MTDYFLKDSDLTGFVDQLIKTKPVIAPVAKKSKFVFSQIEAATELRLDYDVTILPPKKAIFPTTQPLVEFSGATAKSCIHPKEQVLFGVHFYDIKAIDMLDLFFTENNPDENYLANRRATTLIGSNIQKIGDRAFWASVGPDVKPKGHDGFLTKIGGGYHFEVRTPKAEALVSMGRFTPATPAHTEEAKRVNESVLRQCPNRMAFDTKTLQEKLRAAFSNTKLWERLAEDCFSCGTCNIVCPTCYCFDVQDRWNLDQASGYRSRSWDGCQLEDFAKVSLGAGGTENFREERHERYRHRVLRKLSYLNEKLGEPACVGCGRCSVGCVPDIADPVTIANKIVEG